MDDSFMNGILHQRLPPDLRMHRLHSSRAKGIYPASTYEPSMIPHVADDLGGYQYGYTESLLRYRVA